MRGTWHRCNLLSMIGVNFLLMRHIFYNLFITERFVIHNLPISHQVTLLITANLNSITIPTITL